MCSGEAWVGVIVTCTTKVVKNEVLMSVVRWRVGERHEEFKTRDMSKLVPIGGGGAPPIAKMLTYIAASGRTAWNGFGLTETTGGIISIGGEDLRLRPRSCGKPIPVMDVAIVSDTGEELPPGVPGELVAKGPYIFKEYWNEAKATADAFFPGGWFRTGDLASRDEDGFITILERIKDVIVRGGENISCPEVEDAVYRHPSVAEAVVFGVPHPRLGEEVAVVVTVCEHLAGRSSPTSCPHSWRSSRCPPVSSSGQAPLFRVEGLGRRPSRKSKRRFWTRARLAYVSWPNPPHACEVLLSSIELK